MKLERNKIKIMCYFGAVIILFATSFLLIGSLAYGDESTQDDFILPEWGGGMVHSDPQLTDNIRLPVPTTNVGKVWYRHDLGGELSGGVGNGIAGNSGIAASTFNNFFYFVNKSCGYHNLIIYDYYGNHIWNDNQSLNPAACTSTPMVDMHNWVVACDNQTIILVNASNPDYVHVEWTSPIPLGDYKESGGLPYSPNIVENETIILPTKNGPLLAYDVHTGEKLAELYLGQNETIDPYWGVPEMNQSNFEEVMKNALQYPFACPYHFNRTNNVIEWNSTVPYGIMPLNPPFFENNIMFWANRVDPRNVTALNISNPFNITILGSNLIECGGYYTGEGFFSTVNSACVKDNRVFIATQYKKPGTRPFIHNDNDKIIGRLYAVDVDPDNVNESKRLEVNWSYTYFGASQASPTLINDTIYFDGNNTFNLNRHPYIYAVYTNGTERWNVSYDNITCFSFSKDPRGGFWYEDSGIFTQGGGGRKLVRFYEENGTIQEEINVSDLINETGILTEYLYPYFLYPGSCMTICGTETNNPIMIVSINYGLGLLGKWVVAINLSDNNSLLWKVPVKSILGQNWAGGQYTILKENNEYRVLLGTTLGGVMAIGSYPDCWFDGPINYQFTDSGSDINPFKDTVNVSFNLKTSLSQDKATVKVILHPLFVSNPFNPCYPILYRYRAEKEFIVTSEGTSGSIEISLPKGAPEAIYAVQVALLNSSGDIKIDTLNEILGNGLENLSELVETLEYDYDLNLTEKLNQYSNEISDNFHVNITELLSRYPLGVIKDLLIDILSIYVFNDDKVDPNFEYLYPPNDAPDTPIEPEGPSVVSAREEYNYQTKTSDPNGDDIEYKWRFNLGDLLLNYKKWSEPCDSGEYHTQEHSWLTCGPRLVLVKARDIWHSPNVQSDFSPAKEVLVLPHCWFSAPSEQIVGEPVQFNGYMYGAEASKWLWNFGLSGGFEERSSTTEEAYSESNTYTIILKVIDKEDNTYTFSRDIESKYLVANFTSNYAKTNETVWFNDTSLVHKVYNIVNRTWDFGDGNISYEEQNVIHNFELPGVYNVLLTIMDNEEHIDVFYTNIIIDDDPPVVLDVPSCPFQVKPGNDVTIYADVVDSSSGVASVMLNISLPDLTWQEVIMEPSESSPYDYEYVFTDTDMIGEYFYSITTEDNAGNSVSYAGFSFSSSPLAFNPVTPYFGAQPYNYIPVEVATIETMQHYSFANFNNDVTVWMPMDVINDIDQPLDVSGYNNNGITYGEAIQTENGFFGKGFILDGMGDYIEIIDGDSSLDFTSSGYYSWSFWLKNTGAGNSSFGLLSKASGVNNSGFNFYLNTTGDNAFFVICKPDGGEMQYSDNVNLNIGNNMWMLLTVVYNGSSGWDVYANGSKLDSFSFSVESDIDSPYFLGAGRNVTGDDADLFFNGSFDDLVMFTRALSESEIHSLYNASAYQYSNNFTDLVDGMYNFTGCAGYLNGDVNMTETRGVTIDTYPPLISDVSNNPDIIGFGDIVTIDADIVENGTGILMAMVNISYPDNSSRNYSLHCIGDDTYQCNFSDTWVVGQYNYTVWALDNVGNMLNSVEHCFNVSVSANATISVCTIKDSYGGNETIKLTDPPGDPTLIGYELIDNGKVLRIWNNYDSYYFNTTSGIQLTNHYNKYWSHNVLILGYYNNNQWNLIYRTDELSGFNKNIDTDNETYVNAILWKNLTYQGYDFRLAIRYHLGVDDKELTVIPYIKNLGQAIPYTLGFAWEIKDIQVNMTPSGDYIEINGTTYYLYQSLDETYKNMNQPCFYIRENISSDRSESLYLCWNDSLDYLVKVKSREGQYNASVTLGIKVGTLAVGQEKYTSLLWHDASEITYYFSSYNTGEKWTTNPGYMVDGNTSTYASTTTNGKVELCNGNTCPGLNFGNIIKVELRAYGYYSGSQRDIRLRPVFDGTTDGMNYDFRTTTTPAWSQWFDISIDPTAPPWNWTRVKNLDCDVEAKSGVGSFTLYCSKVEIRVTYIPNSDPVISNPYPINGSIGISITPLLNITVADPDGNSMSITWLSNSTGFNSSGSWQVFGTNNSVGNGTYHQTMANASVNGMWWYWKVNVTDGINYTESSVYKFYTGYESKINNTGSTDIKGYLLIQVQYYNETSSSWVVADDTVNETTSRTINSSGQLALDTIFNGLVNTDDLTYGDGLYRVYAAFRDPDGDVLVCDDDSLLESWYEFTVNI
jgi:hypothetical protein